MKVILVDDNDTPVGTMEKIEAHKKALLHRAFSVFLFNSAGELLLQKRAIHKYHSGGLWTNTACSHPFPGEDIYSAASRRLKEEMGIRAQLTYLFKFKYKAPFDNGLTEHEMDHVFTGLSDALPEINPEEVAGYAYMNPQEIVTDMEKHPEKYTAWFRIVFERFMQEVSQLSEF